MAFLRKKLIQTTLYYEPGATKTFKLPRGNLFSALDLKLQGEINVVSNPASGVPDYQLWRMIRKFDIVQNGSKRVWSLTGEELAHLFLFENGVQAKGNGTLAGTVANNVKASSYLTAYMAPRDTIKPWDFALDTRKHDYTIEVTFRDITQVGTFFGTIGGSITTTNDENYLKISVRQLDLRLGPDGKADNLANQAPLVRCLESNKFTVETTNNQYPIVFPSFKDFRNVHLWTTEVASNVEAGKNTIITDRFEVLDTQNTIYHSVFTDQLQAETSRRLGLGSNLNDGSYLLAITEYGALSDTVKTDKVVDLRMQMLAAKLSGDTFIHAIFDSVEMQ